MTGIDRMADRRMVKGMKGLWFAAIDSGPMTNHWAPEKGAYPGVQWEGTCIGCEAPVTFWRAEKRGAPVAKLCHLCKLEKRMTRSFVCDGAPDAAS